MHALELDFIGRRSIGSLPGMLLLFTGMAALAVTAQDALEKTELQQDLEMRKDLEWRRAHGRQEMPATPVALRPEDLRALREAAVVGSRLVLPWERLFNDTADAAGPDVALTGLQPDPATRTVRISGLAKDLPAVNGFVERLLSKQGYANAYLAQHDLQSKDAQTPLGFVVLANWRDDLR